MLSTKNSAAAGVTWGHSRVSRLKILYAAVYLRFGGIILNCQSQIERFDLLTAYQLGIEIDPPNDHLAHRNIYNCKDNSQ